MANQFYIGIEERNNHLTVDICDDYGDGQVDLREFTQEEARKMLSPESVVGTVLDHGDSNAIDLINAAYGEGGGLWIGREQFPNDAINWARVDGGMDEDEDDI